MSVIAWLVLGLISGFIAIKIVNKSGEGIILDIVLGIVGALVGDFLFTFVRATHHDSVRGAGLRQQRATGESGSILDWRAPPDCINHRRAGGITEPNRCDRSS